MKKFLLSLFVILMFGAYVASKRLNSTNNSPVALSSSSPDISDQTTLTPISTPSSSPTATLSPKSTPLITPSATTSGKYKNGQYTGSVADAYYGNIQVKASISGGKITDVRFLSYPSGRDTSQEINNYAMPILQQEAIQAQSANVDIVSGATLTSEAFIQSLQSALAQAF